MLRMCQTIKPIDLAIIPVSDYSTDKTFHD